MFLNVLTSYPLLLLLLGESFALQSGNARLTQPSPAGRLFADNNKMATPYVPDGLTSDEYSRIKKTEKDELEKMDFGAFGPRFKRTGRPDGDWFVMPSLWTTGFDSNPNYQKPGSILPTFGSKVSIFTRRYLPAFVLSYMMLDITITAVALLNAAQLSYRSALLLAVKANIWKMKHLSQLKSSSLCLHALKAVAAGICAIPAEKFLEHANRRWLWGRKRTMFTSIGAALASLSVWTALLIALKRPIIL